MALRSTPSSRVKLVSVPSAEPTLALVTERSAMSTSCAFVQKDGPLDFILQLSNVARPVKGGEPLNRCRREARNDVIGLRGEPFQEGVGQRHDVFTAFAQRRQVNRNGADAVIKVLAQFAVLEGVFRLAVGGGDDAAVGLVAGLAADRADFVVLQDAQQLALRVDGHFGDFVEQQRAAFRLAEKTFAVGVRAGERAFDRTEQFAFDQFAGQGGAIDFDDFVFAARTERVEEVGDDFLAGAAFAGDEHGDIAGGDAFNGAHDFLHGGAAENGRRRAAHRFQRAPERAVFLVLLLAFDGALDVGHQLFIFKRLGEKVIGAAASGFDGHADGAVSGEHDDFGVGPAFFDLRQQFQAVGIRQFHVEQHHVGRWLGKGLLQRRAVVGLGDFVIDLRAPR